MRARMHASSLKGSSVDHRPHLKPSTCTAHIHTSAQGPGHHAARPPRRPPLPAGSRASQGKEWAALQHPLDRCLPAATGHSVDRLYRLNTPPHPRIHPKIAGMARRPPSSFVGRGLRLLLLHHHHDARTAGRRSSSGGDGKGGRSHGGGNSGGCCGCWW